MYNSQPIQISNNLLNAFPDAMRPALQTIFDAARLKFRGRWYFQQAVDYLLADMQPVFSNAVKSAEEAGSMLRLVGGWLDLLIDQNPTTGSGWAELNQLKQSVRTSDAWWKFTTAMQVAANNSQRKTQAPEGARKRPAGTGIGENIKKLRKECGWSQDDLAAKSGVDKKQIVSHEKGNSKPQPRTARLYADTFTKELGRKITANDLES